MPGPQSRIRILEDDVSVVRYHELLKRTVEKGESADSIAKELGVSPAAIIFHLQKMGLVFNRREGKWVIA